MDPAPRAFLERAPDPELGVRVPFACDSAGDDSPRSVRRVDGRRVTQCALSRVCGVCGASLGRPIAFLGSPVEADRNAYYFPPCHLECAALLLDEVAGLDVAVLGQHRALDTWVLTTTPAFEFVRPDRADEDRRPTFRPVEVLTSTR